MIFNIELTPEELQILSEALGALPFVKVAKMISNLQAQVTKQELEPHEP